MELSANKIYKHQDIRDFLNICPMCKTNEDIALWSSYSGGSLNRGKEGITCNRCHLDLVFSFAMDFNNEIIDQYSLEHFKIGKLEFKNNNQQLALYLNNIYIKDVNDNVVDLEQCKVLLLLS